MQANTRLIAFALIAAVSVIGRSAWAESIAGNISASTGPALGAGIAASYFLGGSDGPRTAARAAEAVVLSYGVSKAIQRSVDLNLDGRHRAFPSAHAATSFALAGSLSELRPKRAWLFYTGAALIGWSTVAIDGHAWGDVIGGAALGIALGRWSMSTRNGPMIGRVIKF